MLVLKGNAGKSQVLFAIKNMYDDSFIMIYDNDFLTIEDSHVASPNDGTIEELCNYVKTEVYKEDRSRTMIIIYTNLHESEVGDIKQMLETFETDGYCRCGIVMCKE